MGFSRQEYWSGVPLPSLVQYITLNFKNQVQNSCRVCFHFCKNKTTTTKNPPKSHKQKTQNYIWAVSRLDPALDDIAACPLKGLWNPLISYSCWRCPLKILFCHLLKLTVQMQEEGLPKIIFFHISFLLGGLCTVILVPPSWNILSQPCG